MIEELHALGEGVAETYGGLERALWKYVTRMNPNLRSSVGIFDARKMEITSVANPRTNATFAESYILYTSGANDTPANYSPAFRSKDTKKHSAEENIKKDMEVLLRWTRWPKDYREVFERIREFSKEIAESAKRVGAEYVVIRMRDRAHIEDPIVLRYFTEQISLKRILKDAIPGTCMICGRRGEVTGAALRLANLKFATPDKEVFVPLGFKKEQAFSVQFPLCKDDAVKVMIGAAFAASETVGRLRGRIHSVGNVSYEYIVLPMPRSGREVETVETVELKWQNRQRDEKKEAPLPDRIAAMADVGAGEDADLVALLSPMAYVSVYFLEKSRATAIIGSARYIRPTIITRLVNARSHAQRSVDRWFGRGPEHAPQGWMARRALFYDMVALQVVQTDQRGRGASRKGEKDVAVAIKQAVQYYVSALSGQWRSVEVWLKHTIVRNAGRILLAGKDARAYLQRGVAAVLTIESAGGEKNMGVEDLIDLAKGVPDLYVAFLAGLLSAEAMYLQRREKNLHVGEEPFRRVVGNAATGDLEDFKRILVLAVDKINQYGGSPSRVLKDYPIDVPELLNVRKTSKTEDLRFAFVLGLLVGETAPARISKENVGGETHG